MLPWPQPATRYLGEFHAHPLLRGQPPATGLLAPDGGSPPATSRAPGRAPRPPLFTPALYATPATWPSRGESPSNAISQWESEGRMYSPIRRRQENLFPATVRSVRARVYSCSIRDMQFCVYLVQRVRRKKITFLHPELTKLQNLDW